MGNFKVKYALLVAITLLLSQIFLIFATPQRVLAATPATSTTTGHTTLTARQDSIRDANARRAAQRTRRTQSEQRNGASATSLGSERLSTPIDTVDISKTVDTTKRKAGGMGISAPIVGRAKDSLYYDLRSKKVYLYEQGEVSYGDMSLAADKMTIDLDLKNIYAIGKADTIDGEPTVTRPLFTQGATSLNMDTITYNLETQRAKIKNIATQQGDGWMVGQEVKRMSDNTINIADGMYTTCDQTDHPHFFYSMSKVKVIPGKKAIMGPGHLVIEDVHIPFLGLPEGFFPLNSGPKSGILMPSYGEEARRGFYINGLGYYFTLSDHMDLTLTGGIYTLGSWEVSAVSRYMKRYKYTGNFNFDFSSVRSGDKGDPDYVKQNTY
ncbi:MAG: LPS-assembly protein LptD, partial [Alistipes sp.]|nr:LPS-assembly protein LptD [Alistipes sp.]